jgi:glutamate-1-semialdehyde 2,1-aminomutase
LLGKIIGGGLPAAAFGGRADIMQLLAPLGPVYQAGTLSGNPIAMTAGLATLDLLLDPHFYADLATKTLALTNGLKHRAATNGISFQATSIASLFGYFFTDNEYITKEADVKACNIKQFKRFFHGMQKAGIYLAPSAYEIGFVGMAHTEQDIAHTLNAAEQIFKEGVDH